MTAQAQPAGYAPPIQGQLHQHQGAMSAPVSGPENIMILLDASYSMKERLGRGQESKMTAAKRIVLDVVRQAAPQTRIGLRVYGDSSSPFGSCRATSLLAPVGHDNRNLIASKLIGIRPTGSTPISYTILRSLEEDFNHVAGPKSIILISDGMETCGEDPCDVAVRMQQRGINVKINVVGYGLSDYAAIKQMRCVALATKGKYYSANTAAELANSLNQAMAVEKNVQGTIIMPTAPTQAVPMAMPRQAPSVPVLRPVGPEFEMSPIPIQPNTR